MARTYLVYYGEDLIFQSNAEVKELQLSSAVFSTKINNGETFEFTAPYYNRYCTITNEFEENHSKYGDTYGEGFSNIFKKPVTIRVIYDGYYLDDHVNNYPGRWLWTGFVIDQETDFYGNKKVHCENLFSFLSGSMTTGIRTARIFLQTGRTLSIRDFLNYLVDGSTMDTSSMMVNPLIRLVTVEGEISNETIDLDSLNLSYSEDEIIQNFNDVLSSFLLEKYGGYIFIKPALYIDGHSLNPDSYSLYYCSSDALQKKTDFELSTETNILDLTKHINTSNTYNGILPVGKDEMYIQPKDFGSISQYLLRNETIANYGGNSYFKIQYFDKIESQAELSDEGQKFINSVPPYEMVLEVKAVDLSIKNVYGRLPYYPTINCGDLIKVVSKKHYIDDYFLCTSISLNLLNPESSEYTFGANNSSLTQQTNENSKKYDYSIDFSHKNIADINNRLSGT